METITQPINWYLLLKIAGVAIIVMVILIKVCRKKNDNLYIKKNLKSH